MQPQTKEFRPNYNVMQICGKKYIGKSFKNREIIDDYLKNTKRKVLVYNIHGEDTYADIPPIKISPNEAELKPYLSGDEKDKEIYQKVREYRKNVIRGWNKIEAMCAIPKHHYGTAFDPVEKKDLLADILDSYTDGLLIVEDIDQFAQRTADQRITGTLFGNRHTRCDIIIVHQSVSMVSQFEWRSTNYMQLFKTMDKASSSKTIPEEKKPLVEIAESIVEEQVKFNPNYFVYIDFDNYKIKGCKQQNFEVACNSYINKYYKKRVKPFLDYTDDKGNKMFNEATAYQEALKEVMVYAPN